MLESRRALHTFIPAQTARTVSPGDSHPSPVYPGVGLGRAAELSTKICGRPFAASWPVTHLAGLLTSRLLRNGAAKSVSRGIGMEQQFHGHHGLVCVARESQQNLLASAVG